MVEQRLHTYRTNWTLHCLISDFRPKRETIRMQGFTVKREPREALTLSSKQVNSARTSQEGRLAPLFGRPKSGGKPPFLTCSGCLSLEHPGEQVPETVGPAAEQQHQQQPQPGHHQLKLAISSLVHRGKRALREIRWWCVSSHNYLCGVGELVA
jgi:hypothetical protein